MSNDTLAHHDTLPGGDPIGTAARAMFDGFHLEYRLGEGGMGEVWLAEQLEPVRRQVALKVIKAGMDSKEVVARFESERQALALMDHPAIATVFDGGATPEGRPYFVMEYVPGLPITEHCDEHRLSTTERLELLRRGVRGRPARAPEGGHPPRPQAVEHPGLDRSTARRSRRSSTSASPRPRATG